MGEGGEENEKFKISLDRAHQYNNVGNTNALAEVVPINYSMIVGKVLEAKLQKLLSHEALLHSMEKHVLLLK